MRRASAVLAAAIAIGGAGLASAGGASADPRLPSPASCHLTVHGAVTVTYVAQRSTTCHTAHHVANLWASDVACHKGGHYCHVGGFSCLPKLYSDGEHSATCNELGDTKYGLITLYWKRA